MRIAAELPKENAAGPVLPPLELERLAGWVRSLPSFGTSPSKNARRTQRVMQSYQRLTAGSTN